MRNEIFPCIFNRKLYYVSPNLTLHLSDIKKEVMSALIGVNLLLKDVIVFLANAMEIKGFYLNINNKP